MSKEIGKMEECIFCQIARRELPATIVYEDNLSVAFRDINPKAPVHILVIPKKHIRSLVEAEKEDAPLLGHLIHIGNEVARKENISNKGYRLVINSGLESGQSVWHIHLHVLGGRKMTWPPG
jgi:histidine triad (HIT) family protein